MNRAMLHACSANPYAILCFFPSSSLSGSRSSLPLLGCIFLIYFSHRDPSRSLRRSWRLSQSTPILKPQRHYITLLMPSFCASQTRLPTIGPTRITHKAGNWPQTDTYTPLQTFKLQFLFLRLSKSRISRCITSILKGSERTSRQRDFCIG